MTFGNRLTSLRCIKKRSRTTGCGEEAGRSWMKKVCRMRTLCYLFFGARADMNLFRGNPRSIVALAVAYALVIQALLLSFNFGASAARLGIDIQTAICLSDVSGTKPAGIPRATPAHSDCCILCSVPALGAIADGNAPAVPAYWSHSSQAPPRDTQLTSGAVERLPGLARAPPRA